MTTRGCRSCVEYFSGEQAHLRSCRDEKYIWNEKEILNIRECCILSWDSSVVLSYACFQRGTVHTRQIEDFLSEKNLTFVWPKGLFIIIEAMSVSNWRFFLSPQVIKHLSSASSPFLCVCWARSDFFLSTSAALRPPFPSFSHILPIKEIICLHHGERHSVRELDENCRGSDYPLFIAI